MRVILTILLIALLTIAIKAEVKVKTVYKCPQVCDCPAIYKPVCGKTGLTHGNACLAACFKDKIANIGECKNCKGPKKISKSKCYMARVGKTGRRKRCCSWVQQGLRTINKRCSWKGKATYMTVKRVCKWAKYGKNAKRKRCCSYKRYRCGKLARHSKKVCKFYGKVITKTYKNNCRWKAFGARSRKLYCCKKVKVCKGKKCKLHNNCNYTGAVVTSYKFTKCSMTTRKSKKCKQLRCCTFVKKCKRQGRKASKCVKKKLRCNWKGKQIKKRTTTVCKVKIYGKNGRRTHCCTYKKVKHGKKTSLKSVRCFWKGCAVKTTQKGSCKWRKRGKYRQNYCCTIFKKCSCGKCATFKKRCKFVGKKIRVHKGKCNWVKCSRGGRQKRCCSYVKKCFKGVCKTKKTCRRVGVVHRRKVKPSCKWVRISKGIRRRKCCTKVITCKGRVCKVGKKSCRFTGNIVYVNNKVKHCTWKKHGKHGRRRQCCQYKVTCVKTKSGKKCSKKKKSCSFKGFVVRRIKMKSCHVKKYGKGTRKHCCKWIKFCNGSKCHPIKKKCKWTGSLRKKSTKLKCRFVMKSKGVKQRRCCTYTTTCVGRKCKTSCGKCSFFGAKVTLKHNKKCYSKTVGQNGRQKYCCTRTTKCKGGKCNTKVHSCKKSGPLRVYIVKAKCYKKTVRGYSYKKCCVKKVHCVGKKCKVISNKCKNGKKTKCKKHSVCKWVNSGKQFRRYKCCSKGKNGALFGCVYKGKKIPRQRKFNKSQRKCVNKGNVRTCCTVFSACKQYGRGKISCRVMKRYNCKRSLKVTAKPGVCASTGDPHYTLLSGKKWNFYTTGEWVLLKSRSFSVYTRTKKWGKASVNTDFVVNANGDMIKNNGHSTSSYLVNGKKVSLRKGQTHKLRKGGRIKQLTNKRVFIYARNGAYADISINQIKGRAQPVYDNIILRVPNKKAVVGGLCIGKKASAGNYFRKHVLQVTRKTPKCTGKRRVVAMKKCKSAGCSNSGLEACITDVCLNFPVKGDIEAQKDLKQDIKNERK